MLSAQVLSAQVLSDSQVMLCCLQLGYMLAVPLTEPLKQKDDYTMPGLEFMVSVGVLESLGVFSITLVYSWHCPT